MEGFERQIIPKAFHTIQASGIRSNCDLIFLSQSFWLSENPCLPLLNEFGPAEVGVSLEYK